MNDFDKTEYWKAKIKKKIETLFAEVQYKLKDIVDDVNHASGSVNKDFQRAVYVFGMAYDKMFEAVDTIGKKDVIVKPPDPKIILPKGVKVRKS